MKKLKLCGIKKDENRAEFTIDKTQNFVAIIKKIVIKLTGEVDWQLFSCDDPEGGCVDEKLENLTDWCVYRKYKNYELDIFVGKEKIILVVRSSLKNQKKIVKELMKFCAWKKTNK